MLNVVRISSTEYRRRLKFIIEVGGDSSKHYSSNLFLWKKRFELVFITEKKNWPIWLKQSEDIQIFYRRPPVGDIVLNGLTWKLT